MKKILITLLFGSILNFCNLVLAEDYYFKQCKTSENLYGNYFIDLEFLYEDVDIEKFK